MGFSEVQEVYHSQADTGVHNHHVQHTESPGADRNPKLLVLGIQRTLRVFI